MWKVSPALDEGPKAMEGLLCDVKGLDSPKQVGDLRAILFEHNRTSMKSSQSYSENLPKSEASI